MGPKNSDNNNLFYSVDGKHYMPVEGTVSFSVDVLDENLAKLMAIIDPLEIVPNE